MKGAALAFTLRASETDFSLPKPTLQAIRPCTSNARKPSKGKPQSATFFARGVHYLGATRPGRTVATRPEIRIAARLAGQLLPPAFSRNGLIRSTGNTIVVDCEEPSSSNVCR